MDAMLFWGLALVGAAFILVLIDVFVPTAGVLVVTAAVVAIAGVVCLFRASPAWGLAGSAVVLVGGPAVLFMGLQIMPNTPIGRRLILGSPRRDDEETTGTTRGTSGGRGGGVGAASGGVAEGTEELIGSEGEVVSDLRPIGVVRIGSRRYNALSETTLVRAGTRVRVVANDGLQLRVRPMA